MPINPSARPFLLGATALFLAARLYMVFTSAWLMGVPRLGDDAMLYVSKGVGFYRGYNHGSALARSLDEQFRAQKSVGEKQTQINWRVSGQALGGATFTHDILSGLVYKILGNAKATFAVMETLTAITMSVCFMIFLKAFFGAEAAGVALILLSFLLLPAQGIHYLIPSTLALSLGLFAVSLAAENPEARGRLGVLAFLIAFLHNMGYVWLCVAFALGALELWRRKRRREILGLGAALLSPILIKAALVAKVEYFSLPYLAWSPPAPDRIAVVWSNLSAFCGYLARRDLLFSLYLVLAFAAAGFRWGGGRFEEKQKALAALFLLMLGLAFAVHLPFYPSEVAFRVFTALSIPLAGIFSIAVVEKYRESGPPARCAIAAALLGFTLVGASRFNGYVRGNIRPFVIRDGPYKEALSKLDPSTDSLFFLETEYSFRQSVINGDEKFKSYQWPLLSSQESGADFVSEKRPTVLIAPVTELLNTANLSPSGRWTPRELGLSAAVVSRAVIELGGRSDAPLRILIKNTGAATTISASLGKESKTIAVPARSRSNIEIEPRRSSSVALVFQPGSRVWLTGISRGKSENPAVSWPWGENIRLSYKFYLGEAGGGRQVDFSLAALLKEWEADALLKRIKSFRPLSDASGLILAKVEWK